jgi:vancomycin permeability regulator SanA
MKQEGQRRPIKSIIGKFFQIFLIFGLSVFFLFGALRVFMILSVRDDVYTTETIPPAQVAVVFGAGLNRDGTPSSPLRDRIDIAIQLYEEKKIKKVLMSGDNRFVYYNEPEAMRQYALSQGLPDEDIVLDYAGRRTYDTCFRAKAIFGLENVILVTQNYHLPRALFLCKNLNLNANGVTADQTRYLRSRYIFWRVRELFASAASYWDIYISKPVPVLGKFEPIFP